MLTWHELKIPADANGHAVLKVTAPSGQSLVLAEYDIPKSDHTFVEPSIQQRLDANFAGVGALVGVNLPAMVKAGETFPVDLIWKASATSSTAYTVFVHLLDAQGQVIAQSDAQPVSASGSRLTTSWIEGEYIVDSHQMVFSNAAYTGPATLEVGLYDAATGNRVSLDQGSDHAVIPGSIEVR